MTAITTKFLGPTNRRGARVKATYDTYSVTVSYDHALNSQENHARAALALCRRFGWSGTLACGYLPHGYVFVWCDGKADRYEVNP